MFNAYYIMGTLVLGAEFQALQHNAKSVYQFCHASLSGSISAAVAGWTYMRFDIDGFHENLLRKSKFRQNPTKKSDIFTLRPKCVSCFRLGRMQRNNSRMHRCISMLKMVTRTRHNVTLHYMSCHVCSLQKSYHIVNICN